MKAGDSSSMDWLSLLLISLSRQRRCRRPVCGRSRSTSPPSADSSEHAPRRERRHRLNNRHVRPRRRTGHDSFDESGRHIPAQPTVADDCYCSFVVPDENAEDPPSIGRERHTLADRKLHHGAVRPQLLNHAEPLGDARMQVAEFVLSQAIDVDRHQGLHADDDTGGEPAARAANEASPRSVRLARRRPKRKRGTGMQPRRCESRWPRVERRSAAEPVEKSRIDPLPCFLILM